MDAPGDVPRTEADDRRQMTLWFLDTDPAEAWDEVIVAHRTAIESSGQRSGRGRPPLHPHHPRHRHLHRFTLRPTQGDRREHAVTT